MYNAFPPSLCELLRDLSDPRLVAKTDRSGGVIRGSTRQRDEKLPPVDHLAAIHLPRGGAKAPAAHTELGIGLALPHRLAVGLPVESTFFHELSELGGPAPLVALTHGRRHRHVIGNWAHHQQGSAVDA